ncbi:hypothetical protein [Phenylobacterium sp.]|uniref:hypothetical protein n=1 Tax=Phenylobacterium sp. TaxID=1871053 RepID=UPI0025E36131|nr:hypothetical protein [Phenylobacterium sp.]
MTSEVLAALLRVNLVLAAAVLALRRPARRLFGPQIAYRLWAAPPLAALATLLPTRVAEDAPATSTLAAAVRDYADPTVLAWGLGVAAMVTGLTWAQMHDRPAAGRQQPGGRGPGGLDRPAARPAPPAVADRVLGTHPGAAHRVGAAGLATRPGADPLDPP